MKTVKEEIKLLRKQKREALFCRVSKENMSELRSFAKKNKISMARLMDMVISRFLEGV